MKKITLSILAFGAFMLSAQAQETKSESKEIRFGVKAGLNLANLTNDEDGKVRPSFHIGAVAEFAIGDKFSIQPELLYSRQGSKASVSHTIEDGDVVMKFDADGTLKLDYINIPVLAKYKINDSFSILGGLQVGFLVQAEVEVDVQAYGVNVNTKQDFKSEVNSVDFGLNIGVGYELPVGVFFEARHNFGITNVNKETGKDIVNSQNSVFQLSVGYKF